MSRQFLSLFYFFGGEGTDRAGLVGGYIPRRWRPQPQRTRTACTSQAAAHAVPDASTYHAGHDTHARTLGTLHRFAPDTRQAARGDRDCAGHWRAGNSSIIRIMIALSQAWYIDSNMNKYHKDILLFLVIVNYYLSIDI